MPTPTTAESLLIHPEARLVMQGKGEVTRQVGRGALELSGIERPHVLIVPSAADSQEWYDRYVASVQDSFGDQLGTKVANLHEFGKRPTKTQIEHEIGAADVIWMTGGHTQRAAKLFKETGIDNELKNAAPRAVIGGGSAGTLLLARKGMSYLTADGSNRFVEADGLGFANMTVSPHHDYVEPEPEAQGLPRSVFYKKLIEDDPGLPAPYVGVDDEAALLLSKDGFRAVSNKPEDPIIGISTYTRRDSGLVETHFQPTVDYIPLDQLTNQ